MTCQISQIGHENSSSPKDDVAEIVRMLADDALGSKRENYHLPLPERYYDAFRAIAADLNQWLVVAEMEERVVGTLHLTMLPYLS